MAAEPQAEASLSWPLPPMQYVKNYTDENVTNGLAPPPPPAMSDEMYSMFGSPFHPNDSIIRSLESQNIRRLYPANYDQKKELRKMNHSLLANFLDLLDILVRSPDSEMRNQKIVDIRLLFINMHHLVNEYRTHQARETIRVMLTVQRKQRIEIAEKFQKQLDKISESLQQSLASLNKPKIPVSVKSEPMDIEEQTSGASNANSETVTLANADSKDKLMCELIDQS